MTDFRDNLRGITAMMACCLFFVTNDSLVKLAGDTLPLGQIITLRGVYATAVVLSVAWYTGALKGLRRHLTVRLGLRTTGEVGATFLYLSALMHMPLANISAIAQAAPLVLTAGGAVVFREKVGWRRWTAVLIGFAGIMIIVRPGVDGFNVYALLALGSVLMIALRDLATRVIPATTPTLAIAGVTSAAVMLAGMALAVTEDWQPVGGREALLLVGSGTFLLLGFVTVIVAMRSGDIAVVAPFRYTFIPYAIGIGWLVWGDVPDWPTLAGIAVVIGTGVYTFHRERRVAARAAAAAGAVAIVPHPVVPAGSGSERPA